MYSKKEGLSCNNCAQYKMDQMRQDYDVTRKQTDPDKVNIIVTNAINCVKLAFPDVSKNGVHSILPRKGKGQHISRLNETTNIVNSFILKMCNEDPVIYIIISLMPIYLYLTTMPQVEFISIMEV